MTEGNYSNVGHRGPVYKGLGAMNPCDNLPLRQYLRVCQNENSDGNKTKHKGRLLVFVRSGVEGRQLEAEGWLGHLC
jgi:hypothetical protein